MEYISFKVICNIYHRGDMEHIPFKMIWNMLIFKYSLNCPCYSDISHTPFRVICQMSPLDCSKFLSFSRPHFSSHNNFHKFVHLVKMFIYCHRYP